MCSSSDLIKLRFTVERDSPGAMKDHKAKSRQRNKWKNKLHQLVIYQQVSITTALMANCICPHFKAYKSATRLDSVITIQKWLVYCSSQESRNVRAVSGKCEVCSTYSGRLHACLHCIYIACYDRQHIHQHAKQKDHMLAIDLSYGQIYCLFCNCNIYDADVDQAAKKEWKKCCQFNGFLESSPIPLPCWEPSDTELEYFKDNPKRLNLTMNSHVGLRGLVNLGSTCFMNCVLQAFVHTPMMRDYFLAGKHQCLKDDCLVCEIINLFQKFYTGEKNALVPDRLLHLMWTQARHLAGYEQQDAHEFSMASLDILRSQLDNSTHGILPPGSQLKQRAACQPNTNMAGYEYMNDNNSSGGGKTSSAGIIDQIFYGVCQSDVTCQKCGHNSTTQEAFSDISLELPGSTSSPWHTCFSPPHSAGGTTPTSGGVQVNGLNSLISLQDCLRRFTRAEHLGSRAFKCSQCESYQESTKQLSLLTPPPICCFHLKRFEHTSKARQKIDTFVKFPKELDISPFMSFQLRNDENSDSMNLNSLKDKNLYSLYAVINHHGDLQCGHYSVYVRQQRDQWFSCNDHTILKATAEDVLKSQAYLLFYHKKHLEYD